LDVAAFTLFEADLPRKDTLITELENALNGARQDWQNRLANAGANINLNGGLTINIRPVDWPENVWGGANLSQRAIWISDESLKADDRAEYLKFLMKHEIGHLLGLEHVDCAPKSSVMQLVGPGGDYATTTTCGDARSIRGTYDPDDPEFVVPPRCEGSPILLSLDQTQIALSEDLVAFDLFGTGTPVRVSWTRAGRRHAWLAMDRNGNNTIDSGRELFGTSTPLSLGEMGPTVSNGFRALRWFDQPEQGGDADGFISDSDLVYHRLRLWVDENHNGFSEPAELTTLADEGITSIDTREKDALVRDEFGNVFRWYSSYFIRGGQKGVRERTLWDVILVVR
jgi:hypothetical protein